MILYQACDIMPMGFNSELQLKIKMSGSARRIWFVKGTMSRSNVDALSELCSPFLKGGHSAFIAAITSGFFQKPNIDHLNNYGPNRNKMGSNY